MNPVYGHIVNRRLTAQLDQGIVPWRQPWPEVSARSVSSSQPYDGLNAITLNTAGHTSPWWLTFRQAHDLGGHVLPEAQSVPAVYWKPDLNGGDGLLRYANVYNLNQCADIPPPAIELIEREEPLARAGAMIERANVSPIFQRGGEPQYLAGADQIWMPSPDTCATPETWCHETFKQLAHSTGHPTRLNRGGAWHHGVSETLREGLVADMAASFLSNEAGIMPRVDFRDAPTPIAAWRSALERDPTLFLSAATDAQRAADLTLNRLTQTIRKTLPTVQRLTLS